MPSTLFHTDSDFFHVCIRWVYKSFRSVLMIYVSLRAAYLRKTVNNQLVERHIFYRMAYYVCEWR